MPLCTAINLSLSSYHQSICLLPEGKGLETVRAIYFAPPCGGVEWGGHRNQVLIAWEPFFSVMVGLCLLVVSLLVVRCPYSHPRSQGQRVKRRWQGQEL